MSHNRDQYCIDKVLSGDCHAFAELIDRYKHMVFTISLKIVKNREDAEEIAQDVFLKAYTALGTFRAEAKFSTWLYKIAYFRSLDYLKKKKRAPEIADVDVSTAFNVADVDGRSAMEAGEDHRRLRNAMKQLPENDFILITLHYFDSLSLSEISGIMGISENTAKTRLFRSRKRLADILKNYSDTTIIGKYDG